MEPLHLPGRHRPIRYRYGVGALRDAPSHETETLYVVGGLYGNGLALDRIEQLAQRESSAPQLCFNGDFNWFNVDSGGFRQINERALAYHAIAGNVEAELADDTGAFGCGCAYPAHVANDIVDRSNRIHARLRTCAQACPDLVARLKSLPMFARYRVGPLRVGIVHGDAESLAGWRFDAAALQTPEGQDWLLEAGHQAGVDVFASSHTCSPVMRQYANSGRTVTIANNGAAGMANFRGTTAGLITRIGTTPSPHRPVYGVRIGTVHVDALPVDFDSPAWQRAFLANWPPGSDAWRSYWSRIVHGPDRSVEDASPKPRRSDADK